MPSDENQRRVFEFLRDHLYSMDPFTKEELMHVTTWKPSAQDTYWSKQLKLFVKRLGGGKYRMTEAFRPYASWDRFQQHVTQVRRLTSADYEKNVYRLVRIYEFFMPLTNEPHLRTALDALFYRDQVIARLKTIDRDNLHREFPTLSGETDGDYNRRICEWISEKFVGYSVYHVNGRFRTAPLIDRNDAAARHDYIVDETTAVTRFIFPCVDEEEAHLVEFFFMHLFAQAVVEVVNAEEEIWMTETGMANRLHIWRVSRRDT